jgi:hypothetical protein
VGRGATQWPDAFFFALTGGPFFALTLIFDIVKNEKKKKK